MGYWQYNSQNLSVTDMAKRLLEELENEPSED